MVEKFKEKLKAKGKDTAAHPNTKSKPKTKASKDSSD
jgi:hypothetical protein